MPTSTQSLRLCSNGSSMPSPTETPPASRRAAVDRLHRARAAAGDHREAGPRPARRRAATPAAYSGWSAGVRAEPNTDTAGRQLGQQAEALDELALDAQHPPRVGVHPVRRAARVEQPLVGGAGLDLRAPQQHRPALVLGSSVAAPRS